MQDNGLTRWIIYLSNFGYVVGCVILYFVAFGIIAASVLSIIRDLSSASFTVYKLLDEVGLLVFSIAVIDVSKYLMIEEVLKRGEERAPQETRKALGKFAIIIATALSLEGLVLTIEVAKTDVTKIFYPIGVLVSSTIFILGIGSYQKLNAASDE